MQVDKAKFDYLVEQNLIRKQAHPNGELFIYNYTPKTVYARAWSEETLMARGLILDKKGNIIARPIPKFFNLHELPRSDVRLSKPFTVHPKFDGSLGILYNARAAQKSPVQDWNIASRGSFTSDQAQKGTEILFGKVLADGTGPYAEWLVENQSDFLNNYTLCFEIIYPENRIVVNYGDMHDIVLLAVINKEDGSELDIKDVDWPGPKADYVDMPEGARIPPKNVLEHFAYLNDGNNEGFVLRFPLKNETFRVKVKMEEYLRLHALVTRTSSKTVWEYCWQGWDIKDLLENVPDEFQKWVEEKYDLYHGQFMEIDQAASTDFVDLITTLGHDVEYWRMREHRGQFAQAALKKRYPSIMFAMLDSHDWSKQAWKTLEPAHEVPYGTFEEDEA